MRTSGRRRSLSAVALAVLLVGGVGTGACGDDDGSGGGGTGSTGGGTGRSDVGKAVCTLTVKALTVVVDSFRRGRDAAEILGFLEPATAALCEEAIRRFDAQPDALVPLEVQTPTRVVPTTVSLRELLTPPTTSTTSPRATLPPGRVDRIVDCVLAFDSKVLSDLCIEGYIEPTAS